MKEKGLEVMVRPYQEADYEAVCRIFRQGMFEAVTSLRNQLLFTGTVVHVLTGDQIILSLPAVLP